MLNLSVLGFDHGEDIAAPREAVQPLPPSSAPRAFEIDRGDQFPMDLWRKMGDLRVLGAGTNEILRMLIGRDLFAATC